MSGQRLRSLISSVLVVLIGQGVAFILIAITAPGGLSGLPKLTWVFLAGFNLFVFGLPVLAWYVDSLRSRKIRKLAASLGLTFREARRDDCETLLAGCYLAEMGHERAVSNILEDARSDNLHLTVFNCVYSSDYGTMAGDTQFQTVMRMQSKSFHLPAFLLFPEGFAAKMGKLFGKSDINFADSPEFSRKFVLRGDDEAAVRGLFSPALRRALEVRDRLTIEGRGELLFVFCAGRLLKPDALSDEIEQNNRIAALFFDAQRTSGVPPAPPSLPQAN